MSDTQLGEYIGFRRYVCFIFKSTMPLYSTTIECENIQNYAYHSQCSRYGGAFTYYVMYFLEVLPSNTQGKSSKASLTKDLEGTIYQASK